MNRAQRRSLARHAPRGGSVTLSGGPMAGWVVAADAPCLRPDWHRTLPPRRSSILATMAGAPAFVAPEPGRYVLDRAGARATWQALGREG